MLSACAMPLVTVSIVMVSAVIVVLATVCVASLAGFAADCVVGLMRCC